MVKTKQTTKEVEVTAPMPAIDQTLAPPPIPSQRTTSESVPAWFWVGAVGFALITGLVGFLIGERTTLGTMRGNSIGMMRQANGGMAGHDDDGVGRMGNRGIVTAVSDTSITVKDRFNNSTATYAIDSATKITKSDHSTGSISDIKTGNDVVIRASSDSSNKQTATAIIDLGTASATQPGGPMMTN